MSQNWWQCVCRDALHQATGLVQPSQCLLQSHCSWWRPSWTRRQGWEGISILIDICEQPNDICQKSMFYRNIQAAAQTFFQRKQTYSHNHSDTTAYVFTRYMPPAGSSAIFIATTFIEQRDREREELSIIVVTIHGL